MLVRARWQTRTVLTFTRLTLHIARLLTAAVKSEADVGAVFRRPSISRPLPTVGADGAHDGLVCSPAAALIRSTAAQRPSLGRTKREFSMPQEIPLSLSQHIVQVCLFLVSTIAVLGGSLQFYLGQPQTEPRLDNVHRFMAGVYLSTGIICLWAAITVRQQGTLIYLLALGVLLAGAGRLVSIAKVGLPKPSAVWLGYLIPELLIPFIMAGAHYAGS